MLVTALIVVTPAVDWLRPATAPPAATAAVTSTANANRNLREIIPSPFTGRNARPRNDREGRMRTPAPRPLYRDTDIGSPAGFQLSTGREAARLLLERSHRQPVRLELAVVELRELAVSRPDDGLA